MPTRLALRSSEPETVFALLGGDAKAATFALGWTLARSPALVSAILAALSVSATTGELVVNLQRHDRADGGYTDVKLIQPASFHIVLEAKNGWVLPSETQLRRYVGRMAPTAGTRMLVAVTSASDAFAQLGLPIVVDDVPVRHFSWRAVRAAAERARTQASGYEERLWLRELTRHLERYVTAQSVTSNMVYVVSLSGAAIDGSYTWKHVVERDDSYFHPYGAGGMARHAPELPRVPV